MDKLLCSPFLLLIYSCEKQVSPGLNSKLHQDWHWQSRKLEIFFFPFFGLFWLSNPSFWRRCLAEYIISSKIWLLFSQRFLEFTCIYSLLSLHGYHRDTPSPSASRLWLQGSLALAGETLVSKCLPWHDFRRQCSEKGIYLALTVFPWQPAPQRRRHVAPFCHYELTTETVWNPAGRNPPL